MDKEVVDFFLKVDREILLSNSWRNTTYERLDGSRFNVAIPSCEDIETGVLYYNEYAEMSMALRIYAIKK
jgi:hypothetical protein